MNLRARACTGVMQELVVLVTESGYRELLPVSSLIIVSNLDGST